MKQKMLSLYKNSMIFVIAMLGSCVTFATSQDEVQIRLSKSELQEIFNNPNHSYVYLLDEASDLAEVIDKISSLDKDKESLVHGLNNHIKRGFAIADYNAVAQTLEYAEKVLQETQADLAADTYQSLKKSLEDVIELVVDDRLSLEADMLSFMKDAIDSETTKSNHAGLCLVTVDEKFYFLSLVKFKNHVVFKGRVKFEEDVKFKDEVVFEDAVTFQGLLSVTDAVITNATITNEIVTNLSATNALIANLSITNCMSNLCTTNLTASNAIITNETVTHLSATDAVIGTVISTCDLNVGCNILMANSTDALHGNILKNGTQFIHNFGTQNTFVGAGAGNFTMTGDSNTAIGTGTLAANTTGFSNTAVGTDSLTVNTIGSQNTAVGTGTLNANITGANNVAVGFAALLANVTGDSNTAVGNNALAANLVSSNTAVGDSALSDNTFGIHNTAFGSAVLTNNITGNDNTAVGFEALSSNTTGIKNTALGSNALTLNTIGSNNVAVGSTSLPANTIGANNVAAGFNALAANTTGNNNTTIGTSTLSANVTGSSNIAIGTLAGFITSGDDNIIIGHPGAGAENGAIRIGQFGAQTTCFIQGISGVVVAGGVPVIVDVAGQLGTVVSKRSAKKEIKSIGDRSARILDLEPVSFVYRNDAIRTPQFGLIAEDVAQVLPELVQYDADGQPATVYYQHLPVLNLNELKKLVAEVIALKARVAALEAAAN